MERCSASSGSTACCEVGRGIKHGVMGVKLHEKSLTPQSLDNREILLLDIKIDLF